MAKRKRKLSRKQLAVLAKGRATRRRNLRKKTTRKSTRKRTTKKRTTAKRRTTRKPTRRKTVARRKTSKKRRTPRKARAFTFIPAGAPKQVAFGTAGFIGVQLIVDKAPIPPQFKKGTSRIFAKAGAAIALGMVLRKFAGLNAADTRAIVIGGLMSPALDVAGGMLAKVPGLKGIEGGALGESDDPNDPLQITDAREDAMAVDELEALADALST